MLAGELDSQQSAGDDTLTLIIIIIILQGEIHPRVSPVLFGGNLIALEKKTGGVCPIAVGYTLRRIAAKCANSYAASQLADYFSPIQLGVGTPGGCEAVVHATRRYIEAMPEGHVSRGGEDRFL